MTVRFHHGRQPNDPDQPRITLRALRGATIVPPTSVDWLSTVTSWPMLGNDTCGDCVEAAAGHVAQAVNWYGQKRNAPVATGDAVGMYSAITGYDPKTGNNDNGTTLQEGLTYWRQNGIGGNKIAAFAQLDATNIPLIQSCIAIFGAVYTGFNFPASAMTQFNAGKPWTVVRSQIEGGHCVPLGAYDPTGFTCVTWGQTQKMDLKFFRTYFDEVWVPIDLDWLEAVGTSPAGLDTATLNADFMALTGQPGPFPMVTPPPTPVPPAPGNADQTLAAAAHAWLTAKGL